MASVRDGLRRFAGDTTREVWGALLFSSLFALLLSLIFFYDTQVRELPRHIYWIFGGASFLFFLIEPMIRRRFPYTQANLVVLMVYVSLAHIAVMTSQRFDEEGYIFWLYLFAVFSGGLSFGLRGSLGTAITITMLFSFSKWGYNPQTFDLFSVDSLAKLVPLFFISIVLGFLVEQKMRQERETFEKLAQVTALRRLRDVTRIEERTDLNELMKRVYEQFRDVLRPVHAALVNIKDGKRQVLAKTERAEEGDILPWIDRQAAEDDINWYGRREQTPRGVRSVLSIPLKAREQHYVIHLFEQVQDIWFKQDDFETARAMRDYAVLLMDNVLTHSEVRETRDLLNQVLSVSEAAILAVDGSGRVRMANRSAAQIAGYASPQALTGKKLCEDLFLFPDRQSDPILRCLHDGEETSLAEGMLLRGDHRQLPIQYSTTRFQHALESWALIVAVDISELKKLRSEIARKEHLGIYRRLMAEFAHEIRNPLGGIEGYASLLARELQDNPELARMAGRVLDGVRSVTTTINQFLELAIEHQKTDKPASFSLSQIGRQALAEIGFLSESRSVNIKTDLPDVTLSGSPANFQRVLVNLLKNAIEATRVGEGRIEFKGVVNGASVMVSVSDNGIGIQDDPARIFDPFYTTKEKGLGLGLPIVRKILEEEFGGEIRIESPPAGGTRVYMKVPLA